ncbi:hypothetical protein SAMN04488066_11749 [Halorubrum aquaticum]|uniref:Uncharacterized protein n=1 Tax=Halorubrum aquaticum TaxID=387340 RepID=A0A1I3C2G6_9EURY|nr:DUF6498-containing protein [Halorubrum aquaticum]SFH68181.1 hypothetical protein SAMN04488066_11749 [Halorubrum aquaticum]
MVALHRPPGTNRSEAVAVANLLPLVGVVWLGWNAAALVTLYWFELGIAAFFAVVRGLFAGRPSDLDTDALVFGALASKPLALSIPRTGVRIHLSSVLSLVVVAPILGVTWFVLGGVVLGFVGADSLPSAALETVTIAVGVVLLSEAGTTVLDYFHRGGYREESAGTAVSGVFFRLATVLVGGILTVTVVAEAIGVDGDATATEAADPVAFGVPILVGVVLVKFAFDLAGLYGDRLAAIDESAGGPFGWSREPPTRDPVEDDLADADRRIRPSIAGRLFGEPVSPVEHPGPWYLSVVCLLVALLFALGRAWGIVLGLVAVAVAIPPVAVAIDSLVRYGAVEYRIDADGDAIVGYDRACGTALWRVEPWDEEGLRIERDRLDERLGTSTVAVELRDREVRLPRLPADEDGTDRVVDVFDRRPDRGSDR